VYVERSSLELVHCVMKVLVFLLEAVHHVVELLGAVPFRRGLSLASGGGHDSAKVDNWEFGQTVTGWKRQDGSGSGRQGRIFNGAMG
jgi:hypothetical protein